MLFGQMVKSYRISRGMRNRAKFARDLGVSTETIRLVEGGKGLPRVDTLRATMELLSLSEGEASKMMMCWVDGQIRAIAKDLPENAPKSFAEQFGVQVMNHILAAVEEELGEENARDLAVSITQTAMIIIEDMFRVSDPDDMEEE